MISSAFFVLVVAIVLAVLGFGGLVGAAVGIIKILFWIALIAAAAMFLLGFTVFKKVT